MRLRLILYLIFAISAQIVIGQLMDMGQGSLAVLIFVVLVEIDPHFSFRYIVSNLKNRNRNK